MIPKQGSKWNTKLGGYAQRPLPENQSLFQGDHLISSHLIACKDNEIWFLRMQHRAHEAHGHQVLAIILTHVQVCKLDNSNHITIQFDNTTAMHTKDE